MADHGVMCSMGRSGNVWDNAAMESFFSSLKTQRTARITYRAREETKADVFAYIERSTMLMPALYNRLHEPHGVRATSRISLGRCHPNRQAR